MNDPIVIVAAKRTPVGGFQGALKSFTSPELGALVIKDLMKDTNDLLVEKVDMAIMGCVLPAGTRQAPARQAALNGGLANSTDCVTINKVCGSGLKAVMMAHDLILSGSCDIIVAGGMESMSNAPYLLEKARSGYRFGHGTIIDHMQYDGLEDAYEKGKSMGIFAEDVVKKYNFSREQIDDFAKESVLRAKAAIKDKKLESIITPLKIKAKEGEIIVQDDEQPLKLSVEKIPTLKPAFMEGGVITAANSSSIADGAAVVIVMKKSMAEKLKLPILAMIKAHATHSQEPHWYTTAPCNAVSKVLKKAGWSVDDVDLYEVNEAFAVVPMAVMVEHNIPHEKMNIHGGACAIGHPIGASGSRILVTLLNCLQTTNKKKGVASLCIGGGEAVAIAIERP